MNNQGFLILVLLCGLAACESFRWVKTDFSYTGKTITHMTRQATSDGTMYVAYEDKVNGLNRMIWKAISTEGNISIKSTLDERNVSRGFEGMATQISDDGKHLLVAFFGCYNERLLHDLEGSVKDCANVYFTESVDGGDRWSTPIQVSKSGIYIPPKSSVSLALERDTGRVYLLHAMKASESDSYSEIVVYVREPNEKSFKNMNAFINVPNLGPFTALATTNNIHKIRYVQLIMALNGNLAHTRWNDKENKWSPYSLLFQGMTPYNSNYVIYVPQLNPSFFEILFRRENNRRVYTIWTNDYGETFKSPRLVGDSPRPNQETIGFCGARIDAVLIVSHTDPDPNYIFIRVMISGQPFIDLPNPFVGVRGAPIVNLMTNCASKGDREYYITFYMLTRAETERMYVAFGILNLP